MAWIPTLFGNKPPLQPTGPAPFAQPSDRDRRALFWWLKRNTSYTAIEHNSKKWAAFVADYEKWLRGQDDPAERYVEALKFALDTQIYYERGLTKLRQGDKSVFARRTSEGWLGKVNTGAVMMRLDWVGPPPEYIAQAEQMPLSMVLAHYAAHDAEMATGHGIGYAALARPRRAAARPLLAALPFDTAVPEPRWDVSFKPGNKAPMTGVYEQVDVDGHIVGGMAYFIKSQEAEPDAGLEFGPLSWDLTKVASSNFLWRLLWEDTRYKDGKIPEEEKFYPTPSDSVAIEKSFKTAPIPGPTRCDAGQACPREGWWFTPAKADSRRHFSAGEVMPTFTTDYGATIWQWDSNQEAN